MILSNTPWQNYFSSSLISKFWYRLKHLRFSCAETSIERQVPVYHSTILFGLMSPWLMGSRRTLAFSWFTTDSCVSQPLLQRKIILCRIQRSFCISVTPGAARFYKLTVKGICFMQYKLVACFHKLIIE